MHPTFPISSADTTTLWTDYGTHQVRYDPSRGSYALISVRDGFVLSRHADPVRLMRAAERIVADTSITAAHGRRVTTRWVCESQGGRCPGLESIFGVSRPLLIRRVRGRRAGWWADSVATQGNRPAHYATARAAHAFIARTFQDPIDIMGLQVVRRAIVVE